jgi:glycosyltransferase involved in cell wall biosynthesis
MADLVSVIMPVWRPRPDWLRQAVEAALAERGCEIELLVVDDGSPEPASEALSSFDDPRLRILRIEHGGVANARNVATAEARGSFLRFIDGDDLVEPGSTARLLSLTDGRDDLIPYGATLFCDAEMRPIWKMTSDIEGDAATACLLGRFTTRVHSFLLPRQVCDAAGEWNTDLVNSSDWDFTLRAFEQAPVRGTHEVAYRYRRHPGGVTANLVEGERSSRQIVEGYFRRHPEQRGTPLERRARARTLAHTGRVYATHRQLGKGMARLARAARLDPRALGAEVAQGLPYATARVRRRLERGADDN